MRAGTLFLALLLSMAGCQIEDNNSTPSTSTQFKVSASSAISTTVATEAESTSPTLENLVNYDTIDQNDTYTREQAVLVTLFDSGGNISGNGASFSGSTLTISQAGDYLLEGTLNGSIVVEAPKEAVVRLILNGVQIHSANGPAIRINQCDKAVVLLASDSHNILTDSESYTLDAGSDEPDAALFSKDDLTILGNGSLTVKAMYHDAIKCKDDLLLLGGTLQLDAPDDGVTGRDLLVLDGASLTLQCGGNGFQTTNEDADKGILIIQEGELKVVSDGDGVQAATRLYLLGGSVDITTGGGAATVANSENDEFDRRMPGTQTSQSNDITSQKGLKATTQLTVAGGEVRVSSADDAVHTNGHFLLCGGNLTLATGDDGIHADGSLTISGGTTSITQSYEGLEGANIAITNGEVRICANDDGINATDGQSVDFMGGGPMGQSASSDVWLNISGGLVVIDADGDGLDSNGNITISGGLVLVNGPTSGGNGALDFGSSMNMDGGTLVAVGSIGMAESPSNTSKQCVLTYSFSSSQSAGTLVSLVDEKGDVLASFAPSKQYQWVAISTPELSEGENVILQLGGSSSGQAQDGWYGTAAVQGATSQKEITLSAVITNAGNSQGGMGGNRGGMMR